MAEEKGLPPLKLRLAASRADLLEAMGYELTTGHHEVPPSPAVAVPAMPATERAKSAKPLSPRRSIVASWWRRHPMSGAVELAEPFLQSYARRNPGKLVAYSAGVGSALWLIKPWRMLSVWALLGLVVKTSNIPGLVAEVVLNRSHDSEDDKLPPLG